MQFCYPFRHPAQAGEKKQSIILHFGGGYHQSRADSFYSEGSITTTAYDDTSAILERSAAINTGMMLIRKRMYVFIPLSGYYTAKLFYNSRGYIDEQRTKTAWYVNIAPRLAVCNNYFTAGAGFNGRTGIQTEDILNTYNNLHTLYYNRPYVWIMPDLLLPLQRKTGIYLHSLFAGAGYNPGGSGVQKHRVFFDAGLRVALTYYVQTVFQYKKIMTIDQSLHNDYLYTSFNFKFTERLGSTLSYGRLLYGEKSKPHDFFEFSLSIGMN